jgi:hypothetical protein
MPEGKENEWHKLAEHVKREYEKRGVDPKKAERYGFATATEVLGPKSKEAESKEEE